MIDTHNSGDIGSNTKSSVLYYISLLILCYYYRYIVKTTTPGRKNNNQSELNSDKQKFNKILNNKTVNMSVDMGNDTQSVFFSSNIFTNEKKNTCATEENIIIADNIRSGENNKNTIASGDNHTIAKKTIAIVPSTRSTVRNIDILLQLFRTLAGKDKIAKITKYVLDLVKLILVKKQGTNRLNTTPTNKTHTMFASLLQNYNWNKFQISNIPLLDILNTLSVNIGIYRQCLRFGWSVFNLEKIVARLRELVTVNAKSSDTISKPPIKPLNEDDLVLFVEVYYNVVDELLLLRKLKVWDNPILYKKLAKHEALSWYYDIILSFKANLIKYHKIKTHILEMNIKLELKERCLQNLELNSSLKNQMLQDIGSTVEIEDEIAELGKDLKLVKLDLFRLFWDFLADTTDVFDMKTPPGTYAVLSLCSGITGFVKLWISEKRKSNVL